MCVVSIDMFGVAGDGNADKIKVYNNNYNNHNNTNDSNSNADDDINNNTNNTSNSWSTHPRASVMAPCKITASECQSSI